MCLGAGLSGVDVPHEPLKTVVFVVSVLFVVCVGVTTLLELTVDCQRRKSKQKCCNDTNDLPCADASEVVMSCASLSARPYKPSPSMPAALEESPLQCFSLSSPSISCRALTDFLFELSNPCAHSDIFPADLSLGSIFSLSCVPSLTPSSPVDARASGRMIFNDNFESPQSPRL